MRVVSKPDVKNWTYKFNCTCGCELEACDDDIEYISGKFHTQCVMCEKEHIIPMDKIPILVQINIKKGTTGYLS